MGFTYNHDLHEYRLNGLVIPSVTQVLDPLRNFSGIPQQKLEAAREIGTKVHALTAEFDYRKLDISKPRPALLGYLTAWAKARGELRIISFMQIEQPTFNKKWLYGVTPDRVAVLHGKKRCVIEIKTTFEISPLDALQTAAQAEAVGVKDRFTCRLKENGEYELMRWADKNDFGVFLCQLNVKNWMRNNKL